VQPRARNEVVTPEAVPLALDVAGLGSRMIALLVDLLIQAPVIFGMTVALATVGQDNTALAIAWLVVTFAVLWGYFPVFEGVWRGQTPGKRSQSLRVVRTDGQPVTFANVLVRNLLRFIDFIPGNYGVGVIAVALTRRSQRLGDLAAGTMVVREPKVATPAPLEVTPVPSQVEAARTLDLAGLGDREYAVIRAFLHRRSTLAQDARAHLASQIASPLRARVGPGAGQALSDEVFLETLIVAYRDRYVGSGTPTRPDLGI